MLMAAWLGLAGIAAAQPPPLQEIAVVDDSGRQVQLRAPARRVIALSPHAAELIRHLGLADHLVGVSAATPGAGDLPVISSALGLNREVVLHLRPDLAVVWDSGTGREQVAWLQDQGIAVFRSEPADLQGIASNMEALGRLLGQPARAQRSANRWRRDLAATCRDSRGETGTMLATPAFVEIWHRPLMTIGGNHWLNSLLDRAGLRNVFATEDHRAFEVNREAVLARRPGIWLTSWQRAVDEALTKFLRDALPDTRVVAVDTQRLFRPGPGILAGLDSLCRDAAKLHTMAARPRAVDKANQVTD
jgi:iron complex transport system substrate-binding protein